MNQTTYFRVLTLVALGVLLAACNSTVQAPGEATTPLESAALAWVPESLGVLPGGSFSEARGVSADGSVVVGYGDLSSGDRAFRWIQAGGMQSLGVLPGGSSSYARGVSANGDVVVGMSYNSSGQQRAFRWTSPGGMIDLGTLGGSESYAVAVSPDGAVVIGWSNNSTGQRRAFRWTAASGMQSLGSLGSYANYATGVSADGTVVGTAVNRSCGTFGSNCRYSYFAFRWTASTGMQSINLNGASGISSNGNIVVGSVDISSYDSGAAIWSVSGGHQYLAGPGYASAANIDGSLIVGTVQSRAVFWIPSRVTQYLALLSGGSSSNAYSVSSDGSVIVGRSNSSSGDHAVRWTQQNVQGPQTITFNTLANKTFSDAPFDVSATASSSLPVAFASDTPGVCTVSGATVTLVGADTCTLTASQAGNDDYAAATPVSRSFTVAKASQNPTFPAGTPTSVERDSGALLVVTSNTETAIVLSAAPANVCSVSGFVVSFLTAGDCTVTATQAGDANYNVGTASHVINVVLTLTDTTLSNVSGSGTYGGTATLTAKLTKAGDEAIANKTVAFAVDGTPAGDAVTDDRGVATLTGVSMAGKNASDYAVTASFAGDHRPGVKLAASEGAGTLTVAKATQTVSFISTAPQDPRTGTTYSMSATATSGLAVSFSSSTESVCTVSGNTVSFENPGTCTLAADQGGDGNYEAAPQQTQSITVVPADDTPPIIVPTVGGTLGNNGWYIGDVTVTWSVTDPESDVTNPTGCGGATISTDTSGQTLTCSASSAGGSNSESVTLKLDKTAPVLAPTLSATQVLLNGSLTATPNATDATSGLASESCTAALTDSVGNKSVTCTATDNAGNSASTSANYSVVYGFSGFSQPVDNNLLNKAKAGQSIPLKWRLTDANGAPVSNLAGVQLTVASLSCTSGTTPDAIEEYASGSSGLQNLGDGFYQYNWKTPTTYAGSCKTLRLDMGEGLFRTAAFQFTR